MHMINSLWKSFSLKYHTSENISVGKLCFSRAIYLCTFSHITQSFCIAHFALVLSVVCVCALLMLFVVCPLECLCFLYCTFFQFVLFDIVEINIFSVVLVFVKYLFFLARTTCIDCGDRIFLLFFIIKKVGMQHP